MDWWTGGPVDRSADRPACSVGTRGSTRAGGNSRDCSDAASFDDPEPTWRWDPHSLDDRSHRRARRLGRVRRGRDGRRAPALRRRRKGKAPSARGHSCRGVGLRRRKCGDSASVGEVGYSPTQAPVSAPGAAATADGVERTRRPAHGACASTRASLPVRTPPPRRASSTRTSWRATSGARRRTRRRSGRRPSRAPAAPR